MSEGTDHFAGPGMREVARRPVVPELSTEEIKRITSIVFRPSDPMPSDVIFVPGTSSGEL